MFIRRHSERSEESLLFYAANSERFARALRLGREAVSEEPS